METQPSETAQVAGGRIERVSGRPSWMLQVSAAAFVLILGSAQSASAQLSSLCRDVNFNVHFATGSDELDPDALRQMGTQIKGLLGCRFRRVVVVSFGDGGPNLAQSRLLGERRGQAVLGGLSKFGIPPPLVLTRPGPSSRASADPGLNGEAEIYVQLSNSLQ
ncbi:MAG: hypothetical protein ABIO39_08425 [Caulobacteraceae bacterium]